MAHGQQSPFFCGTVKKNIKKLFVGRPIKQTCKHLLPTSLPWWIVIVTARLGEGEALMGKLQALLSWAPQEANGSQFKVKITERHIKIKRHQLKSERVNEHKIMEASGRLLCGKMITILFGVSRLNK